MVNDRLFAEKILSFTHNKTGIDCFQQDFNGKHLTKDSH